MQAGIEGPVEVPRFRAICTSRRGRGLPSASTFAFKLVFGEALDNIRTANSGMNSPPGFTSWGISSPAPSFRRMPREAAVTDRAFGANAPSSAGCPDLVRRSQFRLYCDGPGCLDSLRGGIS